MYYLHCSCVSKASWKGNAIQGCHSIEPRLPSDIIKDLGYFPFIKSVRESYSGSHISVHGLQISLVGIGHASKVGASLAPNITSSDGCG
jgi:hypothetical protein